MNTNEGITRVAATGSTFSIKNPLGTDDLAELGKTLSSRLLELAIPVAVLMYIWAGVLMLTAGAKPENVNKAKSIATYTTIGLVVILIGGGFVDLIKSILNAGQ
jgi:hypothetical protein